jgi:tetratricopeptide (TPR) repeat protein
MGSERAGRAPHPRRPALKVLVLVIVLASAAVAAWRFRVGRPWPTEAGPPPTWRAVEDAASRGDWAGFRDRLDRWLRAHPDDGKALTVLAGLRISEGRPDAARDALGRIGPGDPTWPAAQLLLGEIAFNRKDAAAAERAFLGLARRDAAAIPPRQRLIYLYSLQLRTADARAVLWELYRAGRDPGLLADLVLALSQDENDVRALGPELEPFLAATPDDPFLRRARGLSLHWRGRHAEALPHLLAAARGLDGDLTGRFALAECRRALGIDDGDGAALLGPRPGQPAATVALWYMMAARLAEARGRADDAVALLRRAVAAHPEDGEAHFRLGQALAQRGEADEAKAHQGRAEEIRRRSRAVKLAHRDARGGPLTAEDCERLGLLCRDAGMPAEARAWLGLALDRESSRATALAALERIPRVGDLDVLPVALANPVRAASPAAPPVSGSALAKLVPTDGGRAVRFEDVATRSGLAFQYDCAAKGDLFLADTMGGGVGLIDYDRDGRLDVYLVNGCRLPIDPKDPPRPNKLFRNNGDGTFEDVTRRAGVAGRGYGMGCAVGDYDNDGDDDLFVTGLGQTVLYRNNGDGTFEDVTEKSGVATSRWTTAAGFGDLDGDGDLDLVAVTYVEADPATSPRCRDQAGGAIHCSPGYFPAQFDHLFRNNGDGTFTDVSREAGIEAPDGRGLGLAIADLDGDGRLDLFVANDASPNFLFRNLGGLRFEEVGLAVGAGSDGSGRPTGSMGVVAADLDDDGLVDLFHTNFLNEGSTLRLNVGGGQFRDGTLAANLHAPTLAMTGFGAVAVDADNDGRLDLFVANGHVDDQPHVNSPMAQPPQLFLNRGRGRFAQAGPWASAYLARRVVGRGLAAGDLDNDGLVDLIVVHRDAPVSLLANRTTGGGHWLGLSLRGSRSGRTPVGARATCFVGGRSIVRWQGSGTSYLSANDPRLFFGLGPAMRVDRLEVRWPSGLVQSWADIAADTFLDLEEGGEPRPGLSHRQGIGR